ncbi:MAG: DUF4097 family beta strand repeat protein [Chloroflexi bacterium]|nr:DUF4097 family beta strand repeat protein [Chloroflexota bacterium]
MKHKWIIATILIAAEIMIGALIVASVTAPISQPGFQFRFFQYDTVPAESDEEQRIPIGDATHLSVSNLRGQIAIASAPGDAIIVRAHKRAWSNTVANAQAALAQLDVNIAQTNDTIEITRLTEEPWRPGIASMRRSPTVALTITVPATMAVTARLDVGDVTLADITGNVDLRTNVGAVSVKNVVGDLQLYANTGNITIANTLAGALNARTSNGAIHLANVRVARDAIAQTSNGDIELNAGGAGMFTARTAYGKITLRDLIVRDTIIASSDAGNVNLERVQSASCDLQTARGNIAIDDIAGALKIRTDSGTVDVKNARQVSLTAQTARGAITFAGSLGAGPHTLESDHGNISLSLPQDSALAFDVQTDRGEIKSELPLALTHDLKSRQRGTLNNGGASLTINAHNGNIALTSLNP